MDALTGIATFDFQILRFTGELRKHYPSVQADLTDMKDIKDFASWLSWWQNRAEAYEREGQFELAMVYFRAALFYLDVKDERKENLYQKMRFCFEKVYASSKMEHRQVPYQGSYLPATFIPKEGARKTLLIIGGFDSYLEELVGWFLPLQERQDYHLLIFDGPGQGYAAHKGLSFQHDYEKVVGAVLDAFQLAEVDAIGVSWGGGFCSKSSSI